MTFQYRWPHRLGWLYLYFTLCLLRTKYWNGFHNPYDILGLVPNTVIFWTRLMLCRSYVIATTIKRLSSRTDWRNCHFLNGNRSFVFWLDLLWESNYWKSEVIVCHKVLILIFLCCRGKGYGKKQTFECHYYPLLQSHLESRTDWRNCHFLNGNRSFVFWLDLFFHLSPTRFLHDLTIWGARGCLNKNMIYLFFAITSPQDSWGFIIIFFLL
jgi:hypothetical protein